jgi:hypothetical protein
MGAGNTAQTTAVQRPKIVGITDSDHNATAFAGTVVLNECGTVGKPWIKIMM